MGKRKTAADNGDEPSQRASKASKPEPAKAPAAPAPAQQSAFKNREKVLVLSTRGVTFRYRHLMTDVADLLPHSKRDNKLDTKNDFKVINEVADMKSCSSVLLFEARKRQDLYLWAAKVPSGPSAKFLVQNVHTMAELKLTGNHLKGSRPLLSFHAAFDEEPHWQLVKEMLTQIFATPAKHHKGKPFVDHVFSFSIADNRVWFRNYQIVLPADKKLDLENVTLVEAGPRFCLNPIKIFSGSFGGSTLYENPTYVPPNLIRSLAKKQASSKYVQKVKSKAKRKEHLAANPMPQDELDQVFKA